MPSVTIRPKLLRDPRLAELVERLGRSRAESVGILTLFWLATRTHQVERGTHTTLQTHLPVPEAEAPAVFRALLYARFIAPATASGDGPEHFLVVDNLGSTLRTATHRANASKAGKASARQRTAKRALPASAAPVAAQPKPVATVVRPNPDNVAAFNAYAEAYRQRWGFEPVTNATVRGQVARFVAMVGKERAPQVLQFYVEHNNGYYVARQHPMDAALKDATGLVTQYNRGQAITRADVSQAERSQNARSQIQQIDSGEL